MPMTAIFGVSMSPTLCERLDAYCRDAHLPRSKIIRRAIAFYLRTHRADDEVEEES
jgi:metal-responsive CopG/Arc/MetJ family transcriptional regulator